MRITLVMADLTVSDHDVAVDFYGRLFGRAPDDRPMAGLAEWHFPGAGAVQVFEEPERAGRSAATFDVTDLDAQIAALDAAGIAHEPVMDATAVRLVVLHDPDGNRLVFTGPLPA